METIKALHEAPTLADFCRKVDAEEGSLTDRTVPVSSLELGTDGILTVKNRDIEEKLVISEEAVRDVAHLAQIPMPYFGDCDLALRSISFNTRIRHKIPPERPVHLIIRNGILDRIQSDNLLRTPRAPILDTVGNAIPQGIRKEELRVVKHGWNGTFDVSIIAPGLTCTPRVGDVIAFGVNVNQNQDGAVQIHGAVFRYICRNGAIARVCDGRQHRIRRPIAKGDREEQFLDRVRSFAALAWGGWQEHAEALQQLPRVPLSEGEVEALAPRLRQAPFFLSAGVVRMLLNRLTSEVASHGDAGDLWDLHNAFTFLGTHEISLRREDRLRLRLGAGELGRRTSGICQACRQLLLPRRPVRLRS
jgi:hypothetical protein